MAAADLEIRLTGILRSSGALMSVLRSARRLDLPDWMIFSGAVYQRALNHLTGRPIDFGVRDYDLAYFDASDLSYEAEDVVIKRATPFFEPAARDTIEIRNQARVHLWFEDHFGQPYAPLGCTEEAVARFVSPMFAVGARLEADDALTIFAPMGLEDLFALRLARNPTATPAAFERAAASVVARWPEVTVQT